MFRKILGAALFAGLSLTQAQAASVTFNETELAAGTVNAGTTNVEVSKDGLTLNASTDPMGDGRVRTFRVGTPQGGLWFGATVNNNFNDSMNLATAPEDAVYSLNFSQAITSLSFSFDYLTDGGRPQPELLSEFATEFGSAIVGATSLASVTFDATAQTVTADASAPGGTAGTGTISFDGGGLAFSSFLFRHQQTAQNIGFTVNTVTVDLAPVPLPAGLPMLLAGLGAFGFMARRKL